MLKVMEVSFGHAPVAAVSDPGSLGNGFRLWKIDLYLDEPGFQCGLRQSGGRRVLVEFAAKLDHYRCAVFQ